jgi:ribosomal protein S18 acetylase RimI-like enzyme
MEVSMYPPGTFDEEPLIRPMTHSDLGIIRHIDRDAFERFRRQHNQPGRPLYLRTVENVTAAILRDHPGVVIEWPPDRVVGYCFTHVWGKFGWLGTLGIAPRNQGFGLGRAVIAAGLDALRQAGCTSLALETMPESGKNIALYTRLGLEARHLTLLCQGTGLPHPSPEYEIWHKGSELRDIAGCFSIGLDPTPSATWLIEEQAGETLLWREEGKPVAFAVLRSAPRRLETLHSSLTVEVAACLPEAAEHWPRYVEEMMAYAESERKTNLLFPINAAQTTLLRQTLDAGFRIVHTRARMITGDSPGGPDDLLMMTLAM